ncbi:two-component system sensor histidine kinase PhoQ [Pantoea sp. BS_4]|uniref:histidine kinase n=1 Tax=Pantoea stewartii TaxID=66269 RepID=A0AB34VHK8_9GAMM|nr:MULTISPECIES: two-component system sensor histidine kinase PhoQ [Pantoea]KKW50440.1 sensor protein PhoQ [Pantoea ananatis]KHE03458.1 sensor protein PhoQ [Pantoea stewartii]KHN62411.1 sensor protein PhoQ [Pantoea stewartii]KTS29483.1 sensor protein PhoQ [Pantoea stewartii]KTS75669.1 sensor protein PhoQ [Pantoea stewartii]
MSWLKRYRPISLRTRFLLASAAIVLILSLSYGMVAVIGYVVSFDKNTYRVMRGESNLFFTLAQWKDNKLTIAQPERTMLNFPTLVFIYDEHGKLLWQQRDVPEIREKIQPEWLLKPDFYEIDTNNSTSRAAMGDNLTAQQQLHAWDDNDDDDQDTFTHSVAVNRYDATTNLPALTIVVVDTIPQELQHSDVVWSWFSYVLAANLILIVPLLWLAAHWSLRPIGHLTLQVRELETGQRENLDDKPPQELRSLVRNLNLLLTNERQRYTRYRTTLADLTHSLKTPLAVLQSTLRSLRGGKELTIEQAEPVMLEQISRISQQVGYYLHRASMQADHNPLQRDLHSVSGLLDSLCSALNKVYQRKGVEITLDISPEITFFGDQNDFMEVMGNVLDNACKYCLEFIEVSAHQTEDALHIYIDDDGPGIPESKRDLIFVRGQRVDTMRPGQGLGLAVVRDILEQYAGNVIASSSPLGGARMEVVFQRQEMEHRRE